MSALPLPKYELQKLCLFPEFGSREDYRKATGQEAPPWTPGRPLKLWFDPAAADSPKRSIIYDQVLAVSEHGVALHGPDDKPFLEPLVLYKQEAATVNLRPEGAPPPEEELVPVPVPLRALDPEEELDFDWGGIVIVRNKTWKQEEDASGSGFGEKDRALLTAIAKKLGAIE